MAKLLENGKEICEISNLSINSNNIFFKCKYAFETSGLHSKKYEVIDDDGVAYTLIIESADFSVNSMTSTVTATF